MRLGEPPVAQIEERSGAKKNETLNGLLIKSTIVAALGGLLFGFDTAVIAGATGALAHLYHLTPASLGLTVAVALWARLSVRCWPEFRVIDLADVTVYGAWQSCFSFRLWVCRGMELAFLCGLPLHRRTRDRRVICSWAYVHR